jgi:hypothetical protein
MTNSYEVTFSCTLRVKAGSHEATQAEIEERMRELSDGFEILKIKRTWASPERWRLGMLVEYRATEDWKWGRGQRARVMSLDKELGDRPGSKYQVFMTSPIDKTTGRLRSRGGTFWTTPDDVIYIPEGQAEVAVVEWIMTGSMRRLSIHDYASFREFVGEPRTEAELLEFVWTCREVAEKVKMRMPA